MITTMTPAELAQLDHAALLRYIDAMEAELIPLRAELAGLQSPVPPPRVVKTWRTIAFEYTFVWFDGGSMKVGVEASYEVEDDGTVYIHNIESVKAGSDDLDILGVLDPCRVDELEKKAKRLVEAAAAGDRSAIRA